MGRSFAFEVVDEDFFICTKDAEHIIVIDDGVGTAEEEVATVIQRHVENAEKKSGDRVVFDDDGIHINDKNGKRVIINDDGVKCYDADGNVIKKVNKHNHDKVMAVIGAVEGALFLIAVAGFLLLGLLGGFWSSAWIVFFLPDIICSIARAIRKKDANQYNMTFTACFAFFFVCMFMHDVAGIPQLWNPMWVVFLAIPIYHAIIGSIHTALGKKDDDDDDDDEKEDKGDVDFTKDED